MSNEYALLFAAVCQMICNFIYTKRIDRLEQELEEIRNKKIKE